MPGNPLKIQQSQKTKSTSKKAPASIQQTVHTNAGTAGTGKRDLGLTVRIEINLPATGDQETYDKIFKSIRENLLNG